MISDEYPNADDTCDWKYATNKLGVSRQALYAMVRRHELFGERQGTGATAPWVFRKADVDRLAERREHERRMRESGIIVGATESKGLTGPATTTQLVARLDLIEQDLDCDCEGSIAQAIADLRTDLANLRAMVEELRT